GLLPLPHFKGPDYPGFPESDPSQFNLDSMKSLLEQHCQKLREQGLNPAILVDKLRPFTRRMWQKLSVAEKRGFLSEYRTSWNVTRHRVPQAAHREVDEALKAGRFEVIKGGIKLLEPCASGLRLVTEGSSGSRELQVGAVLNCTGPAESTESNSPTLYRNL